MITRVLLSFLPYIETPSGKSLESVLGRSAPSRGSIEEEFCSVEDARRRLNWLRSRGVVETAAIYVHDPLFPLQRRRVSEFAVD